MPRLEFEKGNAAVAVPSLDKLPSVIDTLISAVRNGELDEQLVQAKLTMLAADVQKGFLLAVRCAHDLILHYNLLENYRFHMKLDQPKIDRSKSVADFKWLQHFVMNA